MATHGVTETCIERGWVAYRDIRIYRHPAGLLGLYLLETVPINQRRDV
jgi:hypothetical protein